MSNGPQPAVPPMQVGYNYPWAFDSYGQNFGPVFFNPPPGGLPEWKNTLPQRLDDIKALGFKIVRWFILMNGLTYGKITVDPQGVIQKIEAPTERDPKEMNAPAGRLGLVHVEGAGWEFDPPDRLDPLVTDHFRLMLQLFKDKGLQVIPSLVDFPFFAMPPLRRATIDPARRLAPRNPNSGGGRTDIMTDPNKRRKFFDTVFEPLLRTSEPFADNIFAWEVMNEPSWLINTLSVVDNDPKMNKADLRTFLQEGVDRIHNHTVFGEKSTVGHRFHDDLSKLPAGRLPQFHYYGKFFDDNTIPNALPSNKFVGEIAVSTNTLFFPDLRGDQHAHWKELDESKEKADPVFERLSLLAKKGYKTVLLWPDLTGAGDRLKLSSDAQKSLRKFTKGP